MPLSNIWGTTLDIVDRTGSLNKAQSVPNDDGSYTYVISPTDPGVANWIDSDGLREGILTLRMAEFGADGPKEDLGARGRVVKLDDLDDEVPTLRRVSAQERASRTRRPPRRVSAPAARRDDLTWAAGWSPGAPPASVARSPAPHWKPGTPWW